MPPAINNDKGKKIKIGARQELLHSSYILFSSKQVQAPDEPNLAFFESNVLLDGEGMGGVSCG